MPYITKESVATKRKLLRKAFPDFKLSVRCERGSTIDISIMEGPIDLLPDMDEKYEQICAYYIKEHWKDTPDVRDLLVGIYEIANNNNHTETYDGDYGAIPSFYTCISIGKWNKPYEVKLKK